MNHTADINVAVRTADIVFIVFSRRQRGLRARLDGKYDDRPAGGQFRLNLDALIYLRHTPWFGLDHNISSACNVSPVRNHSCTESTVYSGITVNF